MYDCALAVIGSPCTVSAECSAKYGYDFDMHLGMQVAGCILWQKRQKRHPHMTMQV